LDQGILQSFLQRVHNPAAEPECDLDALNDKAAYVASDSFPVSTLYLRDEIDGEPVLELLAKANDLWTQLVNDAHYACADAKPVLVPRDC